MPRNLWFHWMLPATGTLFPLDAPANRVFSPLLETQNRLGSSQSAMLFAWQRERPSLWKPNCFPTQVARQIEKIHFAPTARKTKNPSVLIWYNDEFRGIFQCLTNKNGSNSCGTQRGWRWNTYRVPGKWSMFMLPIRILLRCGSAFDNGDYADYRISCTCRRVMTSFLAISARSSYSDLLRSTP